MKKTNKHVRNKKGQVQYFLENAFRVGFLMVALLVFFLLINFYINNKIDTNRLQAEVTANRILYSDTLMYEENNRAYLGIVDIKKFNNANIEEKISYPVQRHATAKLEIVDNIDGKIKHTAYLNQGEYERLDVIQRSQGEGKGGATKYFKYFPITYSEGGIYHYGTLNMILIIPNS